MMMTDRIKGGGGDVGEEYRSWPYAHIIIIIYWKNNVYQYYVVE